jgi:hypothetical protein
MTAITPPQEVFRRATILPVQRATHTETIIILVCNDWIELVDLCHDPRAYLKSQQFNFDRLSDEYIEWELFSPVTITMQCGATDPLLAQRTASLFGADSDVGKQLAEHQNDSPVNAEVLADIMAGFFHVEFATYTTYVNVIYYPSGEKLDLTGPIAYKNDFDSPVLLKTTNDAGAASFHTDIDSSMRARGQLAASIAQDPDWYLGVLSGLNASTVTGQLTPASIAIPKSTISDPAGPLGNKLQLPQGGKYAKYLGIVMTGLSAPIGGTNNCIQTALVPNGNGTYTVVCATTVVYNHALFETEEVIRRTVKEMGGPASKGVVSMGGPTPTPSGAPSGTGGTGSATMPPAKSTTSTPTDPPSS